MAGITDFVPARFLALVADGQVAILETWPDGEKVCYVPAMFTGDKIAAFPEAYRQAFKDFTASKMITGGGDSKNRRIGTRPVSVRAARDLQIAPGRGYETQVLVLTPAGEKLHRRWSSLKVPASA